MSLVDDCDLENRLSNDQKQTITHSQEVDLTSAIKIEHAGSYGYRAHGGQQARLPAPAGPGPCPAPAGDRASKATEQISYNGRGLPTSLLATPFPAGPFAE